MLILTNVNKFYKCKGGAMLVNTKVMLLEAKKRRFAVPAPNFIDFDSARTFVNLAEELNMPLILSFAQAHQNLLSLEEAALIGKYFAENSKTLVALHLDHGEDFDFIKKAIELGFTSVMIDASHELFEKNVEITRKVVNYAHKFNVTVEAEMGHVGAEINYESYSPSESIYTEVEDALEFVKQTNVDSLAVSIGTVHGIYKGAPRINFERLKEIDEAIDIPLVLHGGSSSGDDNLKKCVSLGISKINIFTDLLIGAYENIIKNKSDNYIELKRLANKGMENVLRHYYKVFKTESIH